MFDGQHCHEGCVRNRTELAQCVESDDKFHTECPGRVGFVKVPDWARFPLVSSPGPTLGHHHEASGPRERFHADPMRIHERRPRGIRLAKRPSSTWNRGSGWRPLSLETREGQPTHLWQASTTESVRPRIRIRDQNLRCVETSVKEGGRMPRSHMSICRMSHVTVAHRTRTGSRFHIVGNTHRNRRTTSAANLDSVVARERFHATPMRIDGRATRLAAGLSHTWNRCSRWPQSEQQQAATCPAHTKG